MNNSQSKYHPTYARYTIQPTITYLVKLDGHTKFATIDYAVALAYIVNERARIGWQNPEGKSRVKMTMEW